MHKKRVMNMVTRGEERAAPTGVDSAASPIVAARDKRLHTYHVFLCSTSRTRFINSGLSFVRRLRNERNGNVVVEEEENVFSRMDFTGVNRTHDRAVLYVFNPWILLEDKRYA